MNIIRRVWNALKPQRKRSYADITALGGVNSDWVLRGLTEDADLYQNAYALILRSRDLFKTNCYLINYLQELFANTFGANGVTLRMRVKETEDRVVYAAGEKRCLDAFVKKYAEAGLARSFYEAVAIADERALAKVKVGDLDLYACTLIEDAFTEWQRAENCTVTGRFTYNEARQHRMSGACIDGDCFIRLIRDPKVNRFGFTLQHIPGEMCDYNYNDARLPSGNEIRMGIEFDQWGKEVAFHFIKPARDQWRWGTLLNNSQISRVEHERIEAAECIHYGRFTRADQSRPAPWCTSIIQKARHLDSFEIASVIAARTGACSTVYLESTMNPEGGTMAQPPDPSKDPNTYNLAAGSAVGLPYGVTAKAINPNSPHDQFEPFRKSMLRSMCAGLPGAGYSAMSGDYESVNFSAGRLDKLTVNEQWKMVQSFDEATAERRIFEAWLEMALATGAIPLPLAKFDKFNKPCFHYRRWAGVDPGKESTANATDLANGLTTRSELLADKGMDFEEVSLELAREEAFLESLGLDTDTTAKPELPEPAEGGGEDTPAPKTNGKKYHVEIEEPVLRP